jgi:hypothetical protein
MAQPTPLEKPDPMMSPSEIRSALAAKPFQAFVIHLADGRSFPVRHPEFAYVAPKGRWVMVVHEDEGYDIADMLLITGISVEAPRRPKGRGTKS